MSYWRGVFGVILCLLMVHSFVADSRAMEMLNLDQALRNVTRSNPAINEAIEEYQSIVAERKVARKGYFPTIGVEAHTGPKYTDGVPTNFKSQKLWENSATGYIRQNLFEGFGTRAYVDETEARIKSAAYRVMNTANTVFLQVAESYINVLNAREQVTIAEKNVMIQARILKQIKERSDSGFGRASDLTHAESRLALSRANYVSLRQDLNQALTKFHRAYGRLLTPEQFVVPSTRFVVPANVQKAVNTALGTHPALGVAQYNIIVRKFSRKRAKAGFWPRLDLYLSSNIRRDTAGERGETKEFGAALQLQYELYDGGARYGEVEKNYRRMLKEYQKAYDERRNVNETVRLAWNILAAEKNKKEFLTEHVRLSQNSLDEFIEEFHAGKRDLLEILDMEIEHYNAQSALVESEYAYLMAYYRTIQAIGTLITEFDTGLYERVGLTQGESFQFYKCVVVDDQCKALAREMGVEGVVTDQDSDNFDDCKDQCDNTAQGAVLEEYGCSNIAPSEFGYEVPKELKPYIDN